MSEGTNIKSSATHGNTEESLAGFIARQIRGRDHLPVEISLNADSWHEIVRALRSETAARDAIIEECAKHIEGLYPRTAAECAGRLRALKNAAPQATETVPTATPSAGPVDAASPTRTETEQCKMVTYDGFHFLAGLPPRGAKRERCQRPALANGYCEQHDPEDW